MGSELEAGGDQNVYVFYVLRFCVFRNAPMIAPTCYRISCT